MHIKIKLQVNECGCVCLCFLFCSSGWRFHFLLSSNFNLTKSAGLYVENKIEEKLSVHCRVQFLCIELMVAETG